MTITGAELKLESLPVELLDHICAVADIRDLLALALCSKTLCRIVIPFRLNAESHLRVDPFQSGVWDYLALGGDEPLRGLTSLELMPIKNHYIVARMPQYPDPTGILVYNNLFRAREDCPKLAVHRQQMQDAVKKMRNLRSVHWQSGRLCAYGPAHSPDQGTWSILATLPQLERLSLDLRTTTLYTGARAVSLLKWSFSNLSSFTLALAPIHEESRMEFRNLFDMLVQRCPHLRSLTLKFSHIGLVPLLERGRWPQLEYLDVEGFIRNTSTPIIPIFFRRHPRIAQLHARFMPNSVHEDYPLFQFTGLPNLRELYTFNFDLSSIQTVETLGEVNLTTQNLSSVASGFPNLRRLSLRVEKDDILEFSYDGPPLLQVRELWIDIDLNTTKHIERWTSFLSTSFPNLTHLAELSLLIAPTKDFRGDLLRERFGKTLPKLRYLLFQYSVCYEVDRTAQGESPRFMAANGDAPFWRPTLDLPRGCQMA